MAGSIAVLIAGCGSIRDPAADPGIFVLAWLLGAEYLQYEDDDSITIT